MTRPRPSTPSREEVHEQDRASFGFLVVHSELDTAALTTAVRRAFNVVFPGAALPAARRAVALDEMVGQSIAGLRFNATLVGAFSALAMILVIIGLFGLVAYSVSHCTASIASTCRPSRERRPS